MKETEWVVILISSILLVAVSKLILKLKQHERLKMRLPPSPPGLPVIGHLHLLKEPLHRSLHNLTQTYGHILFLRLGTQNVLLVSSPSSMEECLSKNDIVFANRPRSLAGKHLNYNYQSMGFSNYGDHWRRLRQLTSFELFSSKRLNMQSKIRDDEVKHLIKRLFDESREKEGVKVNLRERLVEISFNIMLRTVSGKRYYGKDVVSQEAKQIRGLMKEYAELLGSGNLNDFFPLLRWIDFLGLEKRMIKAKNKMDQFLQNLLEEHLRNRTMSAGDNDDDEQSKMTLIEVLLSLRESEPEFYTDETIKGIVLAMLVAGSETTASTMEWAFALLLNHPEAMQKVRNEIDMKVGQDRLLNDSDVSNLKYLQNVINETLRIYPVVPTLIPHVSSEDCTVEGYDIPKGTMLFVNAWTLQRDPNLWSDPTRFMPERFEEGSGDEGGVMYNMLPFGVGRRACPGNVLAKRVMAHAVGCLIQCFEWERGMHEPIDMMEGTGLTMPMFHPLFAICNTRQLMISLLSNL